MPASAQWTVAAMRHVYRRQPPRNRSPHAEQQPDPAIEFEFSEEDLPSKCLSACLLNPSAGFESLLHQSCDAVHVTQRYGCESCLGVRDCAAVNESNADISHAAR
jgi:hypothetical protein